jgi:pSer/pThr/pTyr-binding forkhead associated (FHA) protein
MGERVVDVVVRRDGQVVGTTSSSHGICLIGRGSGCDLVLADETVSRVHALLAVHERRTVLYDLGGAQPVMRAGQPVRGEIELEDGYTLSIGPFELAVHMRAAAAPAARRRGRAPEGPCRLEVVAGKERCRDFRVRPGMVLGRASRSLARTGGHDVELTDPLVSRRHAEIGRDGEDIVLRALGSANGTYLNGAPVRAARLRDGDEIRLGNTVLRLRQERGTAMHA